MTSPKSKDSSDLIYEAAEDGKRRKSFFSFGDEGITATVGAKGRLLRISRHFPGERTGFCVDDPEMPEPWFVTSRLKKILRWAEDPDGEGRGIGPSFDGTCEETIVNDRWPTFSITLKDGRKLNLQYVASDGTIYQKFEFIDYNATQDKDRLAGDHSVPEILITPDLLIRDLDFVNGSNGFNDASANHGSYKSHHRDNCLIREHENGNKKGVLSIHVLEEHDSFQFVESDRPSKSVNSDESDEPVNALGDFIVQRRSVTTWNTSYDKSKSESICIILAYTLKYVAEDQPSVVHLPSWERVSQILSDLFRPYEKHSLTNDFNPTLDFFLGRNLEYILSVCSIPISDTSDEDLPCFALTCGDVDGHRVAMAASYHAFQFLLVALEHFQRQHESLEPCNCRGSPPGSAGGSYVCTMMNRIFRVCGGHVKWLLDKARRPGGEWSPNYWVNGEEIQNWRDNPFLPRKSLANAPFQIIKACAFIDLVGKDKFPWSVSQLKHAIEAWIRDLDEINKLGMDAFPRHDNKSTQSFYLTDHALIWQAVKSAEKLDLVSESKGLGSGGYCSSSRLKRSILEKFATENPQSKKRMIAVTRSVIQPRFLLRSRDTALFSAVELGLFDKGEEENEGRLDVIDLLKNTLDCQKDHEVNDDSSWEDPRRFTLSLIMAQMNMPMNWRLPEDMFAHAMSVLLRGSSNSGLFPGSLNERQEPILYDSEERRDEYWEAVFNIPYILWKHCLGPNKRRGSHEKPGTRPKPKTELEMVLAELRFLSRSSSEISRLLREGQSSLAGPRRAEASLDYSMKSNMVEEQNIVELQDEWLYNEPAFFVRDGTTARRPGTVSQMDCSTRGKDGATGSVEHSSSPFLGFKIDVSRSKSLHRNKACYETKGNCFQTEEGVRHLMGNERNKQDAKKRLWAFFSPSPSGNEACLNTIFLEEDKEQEMHSFFDRHKHHVRFFTEETSASFNTWTTEIHLSFYRMGTSMLEQQRKKVKNDSDTAHAPSLPSVGKGGQMKPLVKVAMGFRFEGDLFDRYWTCRLLESDRPDMDQRRQKSLDSQFQMDSCMEALFEHEMSSFLENGHQNILGKMSWQQRRVLELMLFGRILQRMNLGANEVLSEAWFSLHDKSRTTDNDNQNILMIPDEPEHDAFLTTTDGFFIPRKRVAQVQRVLRTLIGNLEENNAQIALWQNRERDRLAQRPRWTLHDESRFRVIIQKLLVSNNHEMLKLTRVHMKISKLEDSLVKKLEILRRDVEEQHGRLFTYVTVVFLPLGFATGIFSMSEAPAAQTLVHMIYTALGAFFAITVLTMVVKTVISAGVVSLPEVTNWTKQDWLRWKAELAPKKRVQRSNAQLADTVRDDVQATSSKRPWNWGISRRIWDRQENVAEEIAKRGSQPV